MNWITKEHVKEEAAKGKMEALKCSLEHHNQRATCTRGELIDAIEDEKFTDESEFCACCCYAREKKLRSCPLSKDKICDDSDGCCGGLWSKLSDAMDDFEKDPTPANFRAFQDAEKKVCDYIQGVIDKESKQEVTYSVGDRFMHDSGKKNILVYLGDDKVKMALLGNGDTWCSTEARVEEIRQITQAEFNKIDSRGSFTRYYDAAKQEYTGETLDGFEMEHSLGYEYPFKVDVRAGCIGIYCGTPSNTQIYWTEERVEEIISNLTKVARGIKAKNHDK